MGAGVLANCLLTVINPHNLRVVATSIFAVTSVVFSFHFLFTFISFEYFERFVFCVRPSTALRLRSGKAPCCRQPTSQNGMTRPDPSLRWSAMALCRRGSKQAGGVTINTITIIMAVIASARAASGSPKPCLFSDPSSQESFWSNGAFNLPLFSSLLLLPHSPSPPLPFPPSLCLKWSVPHTQMEIIEATFCI